MKKLTLLLISALAVFTATAQDNSIEKRLDALEKDMIKMNRLKVSGYIQAQYQWGEENASLKVGSSNENTEKSFNRFGVRRGRVKFTFEDGIASAVFQLDFTDKNGVGFKDAYLNIKDLWVKSMALRAGIFDRPFGYEISYSSSRRESPERSTVFQTLFPDERDLGAMLILQAPKSSPWSMLKLEAGLFAGNGIKPETDNKRDFIGHLSAEKGWGTFSFGAGVSYYNGKVYQGSENVYTMSGNSFVLNENASNKGKFAKREYVGLDGRIGIRSSIGLTQLRAEYLFGEQPGVKDASKSPNDSSRPSGDTYIRDFQGGYVMFVQGLGTSPFELVAKYDWYDPNKDVSKEEAATKGDIAVNTFGIGGIWNMNSALRLQAYYEFNSNEKSSKVSGFEKNRKDDVFTLRLQYKF